jgi:hypothetical protein
VPAWPPAAELLPVLQADLALTTSAQYESPMDKLMNHGIRQIKTNKQICTTVADNFGSAQSINVKP